MTPTGEMTSPSSPKRQRVDTSHPHNAHARPTVDAVAAIQQPVVGRLQDLASSDKKVAFAHQVLRTQYAHEMPSSPIHRLPYELLSEIFFWGVLTVTERDRSTNKTNTFPPRPRRRIFLAPKDPVNYSQVCRAWRDLSHNTLKLWTTISFAEDYARSWGDPVICRNICGAIEWMRRSRECPLSIKLGYEIDHLSIIPEDQRHPDVLAELQLTGIDHTGWKINDEWSDAVDNMIWVLGEEVNRWESVEVHLPGNSIYPLIRLFESCPPLLTRFNILCNYPPLGWPVPMGAIDGCMNRLLSFSCTGESGIVFHLEDVLSLLERCPVLQTITVGIAPSHETTGVTRIVRHTRLLALQVKMRNPFILDALCLPNLAELSLITKVLEPFELRYDSLSTFLRRSHPPLKHIVLDGSMSLIDDLASSLDILPGLVNLSLTNILFPNGLLDKLIKSPRCTHCPCLESLSFEACGFLPWDKLKAVILSRWEAGQSLPSGLATSSAQPTGHGALRYVRARACDLPVHIKDDDFLRRCASEGLALDIVASASGWSLGDDGSIFDDFY